MINSPLPQTGELLNSTVPEPAHESQHNIVPPLPSTAARESSPLESLPQSITQQELANRNEELWRGTNR